MLWGEMIVESCLHISFVKKKMHRWIKNGIFDSFVKPIIQHHIKSSHNNKNQGNPRSETNSIKVTNCFPSFCQKKVTIDPLDQDLKVIGFWISQCCKTSNLISKITAKHSSQAHGVTPRYPKLNNNNNK